MKDFKNIYGQRLTRQGTVDLRQFNRPIQENDGKPYQQFTVLYRPGDKRCWHVIGIVLNTGERIIVSRHTSERVALKRAERARALQPDRKPSHKMRYKLGIDS